jgi:DNA-binding transcriptional LysR family regulator
MLLRQLEYLSALAREGHFGRAAEACHVSQPALSAAIRKLEAELDVQIVQRGQRFEGFTPEGKQVLLWAHRILAEQDALRHELASMRGGLSGVLRIGAIPTAQTIASLLTAPMFADHPQVRISIESLSSREIVHRLAEFDLDIGLTYVDGEPLGTVRVTPLYRERYLLLTPADFAEAGVTVAPSVETDTVSAIYAHVATGRWSSVIAHAWLYLFGVPDGLKVVPLNRPRLAHQVGLVLADRDPEPMLARALLDATRRVDMQSELDQLLKKYL